MKLSPDQALAGILEPVFAIRTEDDLGIGDTDGVRQMMDWCHKHGLNIFQTLPINETSDDNCPYNAISSLAIDPATLAVSPQFIPDLSRQKFSRIARPGLLRELRRGPVNYAKVKALKRALLQAAFDISSHGTSTRDSTRRSVPPIHRGQRGVAGGLCAFSRFDGGERQPTRVGPLATRASDPAPRPRLASFFVRKTARGSCAQTAFFHVRAMAGFRPMAGA